MPSHGGKKAPLQRTGGLIIAILVDTWQRSKGMVQKRKLGNSAARKGPNRHLAWLNDPAKDAARERIRALFRDLRVVSSNWHTLSKDAAIQRIPALSGGWSFVSGSWHPDFDPHTRADFGEFRGDSRTFASASKRIVATLRRYKFSPQAIITSGLFLVWVPYSGPDGRYRRPWPSYSDARAVLDLLWNRGRDAHRIMECNCGKWFYAKFEHQKYCSSKCREKAFRSTPEWKEYRRGKAREYYWLHKNKNVK